uniref:Candidate secreted effector n=1 Tax=Meloidogyne incognita TaxID=6306 RepID=A0A914P266_MELIC
MSHIILPNFFNINFLIFNFFISNLKFIITNFPSFLIKNFLLLIINNFINIITITSSLFFFPFFFIKSSFFLFISIIRNWNILSRTNFIQTISSCLNRKFSRNKILCLL